MEKWGGYVIKFLNENHKTDNLNTYSFKIFDLDFKSEQDIQDLSKLLEDYFKQKIDKEKDLHQNKKHL